MEPEGVGHFPSQILLTLDHVSPSASLCRGLPQRVRSEGQYGDYPESSKRLNVMLNPDLDQVARALARKNRWNIQPTGAAALNLLGLSTQIQGRYAYMSDGPSRVYDVSGQELEFRHTAVKDSGFNLRESALLVQGLKSLGAKRITDATITKLRKAIPDELKPRILRDTRTAVSWVRDAILRICQGGD